MLRPFGVSKVNQQNRLFSRRAENTELRKEFWGQAGPLSHHLILLLVQLSPLNSHW